MRWMVRGVCIAMGLGVCAACGNGAQRNDAPIALHILAPKGLLDTADSVSLTVFSGSLCNGADKSADATPDTQVGEVHTLVKSGCTGGAPWCIGLSFPQDSPTLTFYVEGTQAAK